MNTQKLIEELKKRIPAWAPAAAMGVCLIIGYWGGYAICEKKLTRKIQELEASNYYLWKREREAAVTNSDTYIFDIKITPREGWHSDSFTIGYRGGYPKDPFVGWGESHPWMNLKGNEIMARITIATNMFWEVGGVSKTNFYGIDASKP